MEMIFASAMNMAESAKDGQKQYYSIAR